MEQSECRRIINYRDSAIQGAKLHETLFIDWICSLHSRSLQSCLRRQCRLPTRIHLPAMTAQSSKSMAGAIIMAGAIVTGAIVTGAIIMVITVGETSLPSPSYSPEGA
jgi:hypothetical protein